MDNILLVAVVQCLRNFVNVVSNDIFKKQIVATYSFQQTYSFDVFSHDEYFFTLLLIDFMEFQNAWVFKLCKQIYLSLKI